MACENWYKRFREGNFNPKGGERRGQPREFKDEELQRLFKTFIKIRFKQKWDLLHHIERMSLCKNDPLLAKQSETKQEIKKQEINLYI